MNQKTVIVLITGSPGVGKTSIIKKISHTLQQKRLNFQGFYTEEFRNESHERIGFDIVDFNGHRDILARSCPVRSITKLPKVGKYTVYLDKFEGLAIPIFQNISNNCLIIDEIGKMELLSRNFEKEIQKILPKLKSGNMKLIASIPNLQSVKIINDLRSLENAKIFVITKETRNNIYEEIEKCCLEMF